MKQIQNLDLSRLRIEECFGFLQQVHKLAQAMLDQESDQEMVATFGAAIEVFNEVLEKSRKNSKTSEMYEADTVAEEAWRGARMYARAMSMHPYADTATIGKKVNERFAQYGELANFGFHEKYAKYYNLLQDLSKLEAEEITTLTLQPWLEKMNSSYAKFMVLRDAKLAEDATIQSGVAQEGRTQAEEAYKSFVQRVNALCVINGEELYGSYIDHVNTIIDGLQSSLAARATRAANAKKAGETSGTTTEESVQPSEG